MPLSVVTQSKPGGATGTWEIAQHSAELKSLKSFQASTLTVWSTGDHPYRVHLCCQQWYVAYLVEINLVLIVCFFVVVGFRISATFSLFTMGNVYSYITVKGKQQYFVGKHWFQCQRDPSPIRLQHKVQSPSIGVCGSSLLDQILISLV